MQRWLLLSALLWLSGCAGERWQTHRLSSGHYELTYVGCGFNDENVAGRLRPAFEQRAKRVCGTYYSLSELQVTDYGMRGSAVLGECPSVTMRAEARCGSSSSL